MADSRLKSVTKALIGETGKSGTTISSGVITGEDYNPRLSGSSALLQYEKMRRNDATVRAAMRAVKQPILSANYAVDPASNDERDVLIADLVKHCLFERNDWKKTLGEALTYLDFGFAVFEKVYEPGQYDGKPYVMLNKLAYRKQTTINKWETQDGQHGVTQLVEGKFISLPIAKLVRFTNEQEGDNYEGISIYRTAYKNWLIKDKLYKIDAVGHEKHALGVLDITYPKGTPIEEVKAARKAARNMRANEQSYVDHTEGIVFQFLDMKANTLRDIMPSIHHHDRQIMKNVLAQFLELGATGGAGSRATSEDHSRLFEQAVQAVADHIVRILQNYVVKQLVDLNFTDVQDYPKLRVDKIADDNVQVMSDAIGKFVTAGALHPTASDENTVRRILGLSELEEEELDAIYKQDNPTDDAETGKEATASELKALRASVEKALYDESLQAA